MDSSCLVVSFQKKDNNHLSLYIAAYSVSWTFFTAKKVKIVDF